MGDNWTLNHNSKHLGFSFYAAHKLFDWHIVWYFCKWVLLRFFGAVGVVDVGDMDNGRGGHCKTPRDWGTHNFEKEENTKVNPSVYTV
jgi:hypothetical protein